MQDSYNGHIHVPRDHRIWSLPAKELGIALLLIKRATHQDTITRHHGKNIELKRGQLVIALFELSKTLRVKRRTLRDVFSRLNTATHIAISPAHRGFVVTICEYDTFNGYINQPTPQKTPQTTPMSGSQKASEWRLGALHNNNENRETKNQVIIKELTEKDFDPAEAPYLAYLYPFREKKEACIQHLRIVPYAESATARILEVIYPLEYTGRKAVNV